MSPRPPSPRKLSQPTGIVKKTKPKPEKKSPATATSDTMFDTLIERLQSFGPRARSTSGSRWRRTRSCALTEWSGRSCCAGQSSTACIWRGSTRSPARTSPTGMFPKPEKRSPDTSTTEATQAMFDSLIECQKQLRWTIQRCMYLERKYEATSQEKSYRYRGEKEEKVEQEKEKEKEYKMPGSWVD
ncbi:hypothetical protein BZA05DRAFT_468534 [Tricharina praecox]|uniref:uncharacterized protein n=1 Tax=Tricharina praecox TaxID=43433 RepID=UPI00221FDBBA|nr:uncharacterized protein BZA05DRAFT_468534 [Tricharina praecox]KAI5853950.1 hypothetical protein BZA05DRAFT_468534 [Tricharina praecox]